jgi:DNA-binding transcriptional regulator LsrR (DeoR family)
MELAHRLTERFGLLSCEIVPSDPDAPSSITGVAQVGAAEMEKHLKSNHPKILAIGTGRALRASVEQLSPMDCPQHRIVSLLGNMNSDGSATAYNVVIRMAERVNARHYPMPLPVFARSAEEKRILHNQEPVHNILELARQADVTFVGIGNIDLTAPLHVDGFISRDDVRALERAGAAGEITSWVYDKDGKLIDGLINDRVASAPLVPGQANPVFGIAAGEAKVKGILGALRGRLINALITNEYTAERLLNQ